MSSLVDDGIGYRYEPTAAFQRINDTLARVELEAHVRGIRILQFRVSREDWLLFRGECAFQLGIDPTRHIVTFCGRPVVARD